MSEPKKMPRSMVELLVQLLRLAYSLDVEPEEMTGTPAAVELAIASGDGRSFEHFMLSCYNLFEVLLRKCPAPEAEVVRGAVVDWFLGKQGGEDGRSPLGLILNGEGEEAVKASATFAEK